MTLFGTFVLCLFMALTSSCRTAVTLPQDAPTAALTVVVPAVAVLLVGASDDALFITVATVLALCSALTGIAFWAIGRFGLANLFRFIPYPVVAGFLAGSGWLLSVGSIGVMSGVPLELSTLGQLATISSAWKWMSGGLFAVCLFLIMRRWSHFLVLPGALLAGAGLYYAGFWLAGMSLEEAEANGFLLTGLPASGLWPAFGASDLSLIDWRAVLSQAPVACAVALVAVVGMLLNLSGIELASGMEMKLNREFRMVGLSNLLAGMGGSLPGYPALSLSMLGPAAGADSRLSSVVAALIIGAILFFGGGLLGFFPQPLLGGLLLVLGLFFLSDWIVDTRKRLPVADYLLVVAIVLVIGLRGFLEGVVFGIAATVVIFVVRFSRVSVVHNSFTLIERHSLKPRPIPQLHILSADGESAVVHELSGYIFFGSASSLIERLGKDLTERGASHVLLDFARVTGFDASAVNNFHRFILRVREVGAQLAFSATPAALTDALTSAVPVEAMKSVHFQPSLDHALEWCEDSLIERAHRRMGEGGQDERGDLFDRSVDGLLERLKSQESYEALLSKLQPWLERRQFEAGNTVVEADEPLEGLQLLMTGTATEVSASGERLRVLDIGDIIAPTAAFSKVRVAHRVVADNFLVTLLLTPEARLRLESDAAELALALDRYLLGKDPR